MNILVGLKKKPGFVCLKGASSESVKEAEKALKVKFADEYVDYVTAFGAASYYGHELTGVCSTRFLDVVKVTLGERRNISLNETWYVIEQMHIDGIVFWQAPDGKIYRTAPGTTAVCVYDSLYEYIEYEE